MVQKDRAESRGTRTGVFVPWVEASAISTVQGAHWQGRLGQSSDFDLTNGTPFQWMPLQTGAKAGMNIGVYPKAIVTTGLGAAEYIEIEVKCKAWSTDLSAFSNPADAVAPALNFAGATSLIAAGALAMAAVGATMF